MAFLNKIIFSYMIVQCVLYTLQAAFFLIRPLNIAQKKFNKIFLGSGVFIYVQILYSLFTVILALLFLESHYKWNYDKNILSHLITEDTGHALHEKEDMFRSERNMYICGVAFFASLANVRYLIHQQQYYELEDKVNKITN